MARGRPRPPAPARRPAAPRDGWPAGQAAGEAAGRGAVGRRLADGSYRTTAGLDLPRALRANGDDTPLLMFTSGRANREHGAEARAAGGDVVRGRPHRLLPRAR